MIIKSKKMIETETIDDVICNICEKSLKDCMGNFEGLIETRLCGGYESKIGDGVLVTFSICEKCLLEKIFPLFKIDPHEKDEQEQFFEDFLNNMVKSGIPIVT